MSEPIRPEPIPRSWTLAVRQYISRRLPLENLLPDRQPYYVGSWVYVFGVITIAALVWTILSGVVLAFFGVMVPFIHETGTAAIVVSLVIIAVAALNLALDFDFIEQAVGVGAPKYVEWYAAFGLMVTMIWLYLEILRLLSKLRRR